MINNGKYHLFVFDCCVKILHNKELTPLRMQETFFTSKIKQTNKQNNKKKTHGDDCIPKAGILEKLHM